MAPTVQRHRTSEDAFPEKTKGKLRLYSMQYCPYAMRARLMLAKKNVEHEVININLRDKPTWYLEKYPVGTVPVIELDDKLLGGSLVIAEYIDEVYSKDGDRTIPQDPYEKARVKMMIDDKFTKAITAIYQRLAVKENWEEKFYPSVGELEEILKASKFFAGDKVGYADYMIYPWLRTIGSHGIDDVLPTGKFPNLKRWLDEVTQDETIKKCHTRPEILGQFLQAYKGEKINYDMEVTA